MELRAVVVFLARRVVVATVERPDQVEFREPAAHLVIQERPGPQAVVVLRALQELLVNQAPVVRLGIVAPLDLREIVVQVDQVVILEVPDQVEFLVHQEAAAYQEHLALQVLLVQRELLAVRESLAPLVLLEILVQAVLLEVRGLLAQAVLLETVERQDQVGVVVLLGPVVLRELLALPGLPALPGLAGHPVAVVLLEPVVVPEIRERLGHQEIRELLEVAGRLVHQDRVVLQERLVRAAPRV